MKTILKRDGRREDFSQEKIITAVFKAYQQRKIEGVPEDVLDCIEDLSAEILADDTEWSVEEIQDEVEKIIVEEGDYEVGKQYIIYRNLHNERREIETHIKKVINSYINQDDWKVKENSNAMYSLQGLNHHVANHFSKQFWLNQIYNDEIREAHSSGAIHIHDLGTLGSYCTGWDLRELIMNGNGAIPGTLKSDTPSHVGTLLGMLVNDIFLSQGDVAGAQAYSSFDTYLAPYVKETKISRKELRRELRSFVFNVNQPQRAGQQMPFINLSFDLFAHSSSMAEDYVMYNGKYLNYQYKDLQEEMDLINNVFVEVMERGDIKGRPFSYPIPTLAIDKDFDWDHPGINRWFDLTAKYGTPYFANYTNSKLDKNEAKSMCCRLKLDVTEINSLVGGSLTGTSALTGAIGVVSLNLSRLAYLAKGNKDKYFSNIKKYMDIAWESLKIKRKTIEIYSDQGMYPFVTYKLRDTKARLGSYWANHFSTIGLVAGHEACVNLINKGIETDEGSQLMQDTILFMKEHLNTLKVRDNILGNLEATPAESTMYRFAKIDKEEFGDKIYTSGSEEPYYTNSTQLPSGFTEDLFEAIEHQDKLQPKYDGGTVLHIYHDGMEISGSEVKTIIRKATDNYHMPYFSYTPTFSVCSEHGRTPGDIEVCMECGSQMEVYTRVTGYYRIKANFNKGKVEEFKDKKYFKKL